MGEFADALEAVNSRLSRVTTEDNPALMLDPPAVAEAVRLEAALHGEGADALGGSVALGWVYYARVCALEDGPERRQNLELAVESLVPCFCLFAVTRDGDIPEVPSALLPFVAAKAAETGESWLKLAEADPDPGRLTNTARLWQRLAAVAPEGSPAKAAALARLSDALRLRFAVTGDAADLDDAIQVAQSAVSVSPADNQRVVLLSTLGAALLVRFDLDKVPADLDAGLQACWEALSAAPEGQLSRAKCLSNLAMGLHTRFTHTGVREDLETAIRFARDAMAAYPAGHPDLVKCQKILQMALAARFEQTGCAEDLDEAIQAGRDAAIGAQAGQAVGVVALLGRHMSNLHARFERTGALRDLDEAIQAGRDGLAAAPVTGDPDRTGLLTDLGVPLLDRFSRTGDLQDLDEAVQLSRGAVAATAAGDPSHPHRLSMLGNALRKRFERLGASEDIEDAVQACGDALAATPGGHEHRPGYLINLGDSLLARFERYGMLDDLNGAVRAAQEAVASTPVGSPHRAGFLTSLGNALVTRFHRLGALDDLDRAVSAHREGVALAPAGNSARGLYLSNLSAALRARYQSAGARDDLDAAIEAGQDAVAAVPDGHRDRAGYLVNLASGLLNRFQRAGTLDDLDRSIDAAREALSSFSPSDPYHARCSNNLSLALLNRFRRLAAREDLDAAVEAGRRAVAALPADHPDRADHQYNLSTALETQSRETGPVEQVDEAIGILRDLLRTTPPDHPKRELYLVNLGPALATRYQWSKDPQDLDAAIQAERDAAAVVSATDPNRGGYLSNLGSGLLTRFRRSGKPEDADEAVGMCQMAVEDTPADSPDRAAYLYMLGEALTARGERTQAAEGERTRAADDWRQAVSAFSEAAGIEVASPSWRIRAARNGAQLLSGVDPGWAADLLEHAIRLLPEAAPRLLGRRDQQDAVGEFAGLATQATALALSAADAGGTADAAAARALSLLEAGRAVLLSQTLETRSDLTDLRESHPGLAERFVGLRDLHDQPAPPPGQADPGRYQAAKEMAGLLKQIRGLEGFASFGLPPSASALSAQAASGPIVTFNISAARSDALIQTIDGVIPVGLPGMDQATVVEQVNTFHRALGDTDDPDADRVVAQATLREVLAWLWDAAAEPILRELGYGQTPADGQPWPRVWWATGGLLGLLPFHAAGYHAEIPDPRQRAVLDRVVSSYTPTIGALRYARRPAAAPGPLPTAQIQAMAVAMPTTPGLGGRLHRVPDEVELLRSRFPRCTILAETAGTAPDLLPTKPNVLACLRGCAIAHFACHGESDPQDPSHSRLLLRDHDTDPLNVASIAALPLDHARLAYLSACKTAIAFHGSLLDEAIHLCSAFQLAGFPSVVGTLWQIPDDIAAEMAGLFYSHLETSLGTLDTSQAAQALHHAVRTIRARLPITPSLWSAHLHAGA